MILVFDIGNSNIVIATMQDRKVCQSFRITSDLQKTADEYAINIINLLDYNGVNLSTLDAILISSVVPHLTNVIHRVAEKYIGKKTLLVTTAIDHGVKIMIDTPSTLGIDRLMTAVGAYNKYAKNCITIDFGTATTIEAVTDDGEFLGGTIFPGANLAMKALHSNTAQLPLVNLAMPQRVVGKNTVECIQSGVYHGYLCMVDGMIDLIAEEVFKGKEYMILCTGGLGGVFAQNSKHDMTYEPDLIPYGLYIIYERVNKKII